MGDLFHNITYPPDIKLGTLQVDRIYYGIEYVWPRTTTTTTTTIVPTTTTTTIVPTTTTTTIVPTTTTTTTTIGICDYTMLVGTDIMFNSGSTIGLSGDDVVQTLTLPFTFQFYSNTYTTINVCSNGFANFGISYNAWTNIHYLVVYKMQCFHFGMI